MQTVITLWILSNLYIYWVKHLVERGSQHNSYSEHSKLLTLKYILEEIIIHRYTRLYMFKKVVLKFTINSESSSKKQFEKICNKLVKKPCCPRVGLFSQKLMDVKTELNTKDCFCIPQTYKSTLTMGWCCFVSAGRVNRPFFVMLLSTTEKMEISCWGLLSVHLYWSCNVGMINVIQGLHKLSITLPVITQLVFAASSNSHEC